MKFTIFMALEKPRIFDSEDDEDYYDDDEDYDDDY